MTTMLDTDTAAPTRRKPFSSGSVEAGFSETGKPVGDAPVSDFTINCEERANWLLRRLANLSAERARVKAQAAAMLAQIDTDANALHARFDAELEEFARQTLEAKGGRRKSLPLLQGTLAFRTVPARVSITDAEAAFCHARGAFPELIETVASLNTAAYRERAEQTGELLPGLTFTPARETFKIKFGKGAEEGG